MRRIGYLAGGSAKVNVNYLDAFRQGLRELGADDEAPAVAMTEEMPTGGDGAAWLRNASTIKRVDSIG